MSILTWIEDKKRLKLLNAPKNVTTDSSKGLWTRCDKCGVILYIKHLKENQRVCFGCSYHLQMMSQERIENLLDRVPAISSSSLQSQDIESTASLPLSFAKSGDGEWLKEPYPKYSGAKGDDVKEIQSKAPRGKAFKKTGADAGSSLRPGSTRLSSRESMISTWRPLDETVSPCDPLRFHDQKAYRDRLQDAQERTGLQDAIQTGTGMIDGIPVALAVMDFSFMGGSMGSVVGEKITRLIEYATQEGLTLLIVSASGGARMQEGVFSLMQMAKISSALQIYQSCARLLYISILTSPTTGGVTASFAMLGDIIFAEPKALIAFAGRRVIEQTLREDLPDDFQTSEYMLHHGLVDLIVPRRFLRQALSESIRLYQGAPFKKRGQISFGVQNPINFLIEEKVRRQWGRLTKPGTKDFYSDPSVEKKGVQAIEKTGSKFITAKKDSFACSEASYKALVCDSKASLLSLGNEISTLRSLDSFAWKASQSPQRDVQNSSFVAPSSLPFIESDAAEDKGKSTYKSKICNPLQIKQKDVLLHKIREGDQFIEKSRFSPATEMYREILTSFNLMLALLLSDNSKNQNDKLESSRETGTYITQNSLQDNDQSKSSCRARDGLRPKCNPLGKGIQSENKDLFSLDRPSIKKANPSGLFWVYNGIVSPSHHHIVTLKEDLQNEEKQDLGERGSQSKKKLGFFLSKNFLQRSYAQSTSKAGLSNPIRSASKDAFVVAKRRSSSSLFHSEEMLRKPCNSYVERGALYTKPGNSSRLSSKSQDKKLSPREQNIDLKLLTKNSFIPIQSQNSFDRKYKALSLFQRSNARSKVKNSIRTKLRFVYKAFDTKKGMRALPALAKEKRLFTKWILGSHTSQLVAPANGSSIPNKFLLAKIYFAIGFSRGGSLQSRARELVRPCRARDSVDFGHKSKICSPSRATRTSEACMTLPKGNGLEEPYAKRNPYKRSLYGMGIKSYEACTASKELPFGNDKKNVRDRGTLQNSSWASQDYSTLNRSAIGLKRTNLACTNLRSEIDTNSSRKLVKSFRDKSLYDTRNTTLSLTFKEINKVRNSVFKSSCLQRDTSLSLARAFALKVWTWAWSSNRRAIRICTYEWNRKAVKKFCVPFNPFGKGVTISLTEPKVIVLSKNESYAKDEQEIKIKKPFQKFNKLSSSVAKPPLKEIESSSLTTQQNNISFLNQAIELAATESVEWRAFYIDNGLSENMSFFEDFLQQDFASWEKSRNVLFYKLLCRSKKMVSE